MMYLLCSVMRTSQYAAIVSGAQANVFTPLEQHSDRLRRDLVYRRIIALHWVHQPQVYQIIRIPRDNHIN
jgi:hypothetical protein